ncbi:AraC family transcriptional regulator [Lachnoclostridium phytofermentans]|uniref:Transcriptional regulator, AraC family n=1 Tax=Lachnoclostridium phytofermentans (strain ATCC 700394 / DSM 18823 / ISDg) TaxID=357809 RepID=A9KRP2_LACP7|nr:AraC family transcriptional regulator [Lachnoclostridium phytofermentans]ABX43536.1 transcriptional regulator, AraC family [Lachnoclostridium phytofermentans ISDg]
MDWIKKFNEVIKYIEDNLKGEISYDTISQIAGCSIYNFQRMFSYIADKPLSEYIRNRRLTLAAFDIMNSKDRIIDISFKYGYESQDAFSRAFRSFHGVLPSAARNETVQLKSCPKLSFQINIKGENYMNYQIVQFPAFKVVGITNRINTSEAFKIVPQIWENAWKDGTMNRFIELLKKTDYRPAGFLGICADGKWGNSEEMDYILAITNHVDVPECNYVSPPDGMKEFCYPASTWVVFDADGELPSAVQKIHKQFYSEWLPNSGYELADLPVIESYMQNNHQEVWIGINKNK